MKAKFKVLSAIAVMICSVICAALMFTACGSTDYASLTWDGWNKLGEDHFDAKTISYQAILGDMSNPDGADHSNRNVCLFNFYEDGTMVIYQMGLYNTPDSMEDAAWVNKDKYIAWVFYGLWEETDAGLATYYFASTADKATTVSKTEAWADEDGCYYALFEKDGSNYTLPADSGSFLTLGFNAMAEEWPCTVDITAKSTAEYTKIMTWVDKVLEDKDKDGGWITI